MLSRPTTAQIINDCRRELAEVVAPALNDEAAAVSLTMLDEVLRNCAVRAAHEVAWMRQEITDMVSYARKVAAAQPVAQLDHALQTFDDAETGSLHVEELAADYSLAGACLAEALDAARAENLEGLLRDGRTLLDERLERENQIKGDWGFVGRS